MSARQDEPDLTLLERTARGDADAFAAFFRRHQRAVLGFAIRRCETSADAADAVSETFLVALRRAKHYREQGLGARPWLLGIALRVISQQERGARRRLRLAAAAYGRAPAFVEGEAEAVEAAVDGARMAQAVRSALRALPASERAVLELVAYDDLAPAEAAAVLEVSGDAARTRLARARARMRDALSPFVDEALEPDHA